MTKRAFVLALAFTLLATPAFAADAAAAAAPSLFDQIAGYVLAALPGLILGGWAWFKSHAAQTEAAWDDEAVAFVEKIAQGVVDANKPKA